LHLFCDEESTLENVRNIFSLELINIFTNNRAEINIKPWKEILKDIKEGNQETNWKDRIPYAYWKGNPTVAPTRQNLMQCNVTSKNDWNTRLYNQVFV
jgi:hypothetical protein